MTSTRIVSLTPTWFSAASTIGGGERYVENLARAVALAGAPDVEVEVVALGEVRSTTVTGQGVRRTLLPAALPGTSPVDAVAWGLEDVVWDASLVHVHQAFTRFGQAAVLAAAVADVPIVITDHGGPTLGGRAQGELVAIADTVFAYSEFGARLAGGGASVVPGGVDTEWFSPGDVEERQGFAYVGRILPHKRVERAIEALPDGAKLIVCGQVADPEYLEVLRRLAKGRDVEFVHDADDAAIRELYRRVRGVVLLSDHTDRNGTFYKAPELMGLTVLEAMACGAPAIVSTTAALPEFVRDGATGFVVQDDEALGQVLRRLQEDPSLCVELGRAARDQVVQRWDLRPVGRLTLDVYLETIRRFEEGA